MKKEPFAPGGRRKGLKLLWMEFCSIDEDGHISDAGMFEDLDRPASPASQRAMLKSLRKQGLSDEAIRRTWPGLALLLPDPGTTSSP